MVDYYALLLLLLLVLLLLLPLSYVVSVFEIGVFVSLRIGIEIMSISFEFRLDEELKNQEYTLVREASKREDYTVIINYYGKPVTYRVLCDVS